MVTRARHLNIIPDSSDDENISDDDEYGVPTPLERVYIPESDEDCSDDAMYDEPEYEIIEENLLSNQPSSSNTSKKSKKDNLLWSDEGIEYDESHITFLGCEDLPKEILQLETPISFFKYLFPSSAINLIEVESNLYAAQIAPEGFNEVTDEDIRKFIGILIYMSVVRLPTTRHYWKDGTYRTFGRTRA
ncbi:hypothetical protein PYW07_009183 [Mythimna separata]|uniref:PiggyBac transposable element-derived protein domain-containing protein n=1 Tax=Mythimna separata TaxID=271217 RepID=A0AAD7YB47_MYTSE|nr:hypothetical protein PYW07_009183 [Mythimna separata]